MSKQKQKGTAFERQVAEFGLVVHKRKGTGEKSFGDTYVTMTLETLAAMIAGSHNLLQ